MSFLTLPRFPLRACSSLRSLTEGEDHEENYFRRFACGWHSSAGRWPPARRGKLGSEHVRRGYSIIKAKHPVPEKITDRGEPTTDGCRGAKVLAGV